MELRRNIDPRKPPSEQSNEPLGPNSELLLLRSRYVVGPVHGGDDPTPQVPSLCVAAAKPFRHEPVQCLTDDAAPRGNPVAMPANEVAPVVRDRPHSNAPEQFARKLQRKKKRSCGAALKMYGLNR